MAASRYLVNPNLLRPYNGAPLRPHIRRYSLLTPEQSTAVGALKPYSGQPSSDISLDRRIKARDRLYATNLLLLQLKRPSKSADICDQRADALFTIACFLERTGPDGDRFADEYAVLAQMFKDVKKGVPLPTPTVAHRGDPTMIHVARAVASRAIETLRWAGYSRKKAAQWAVKKVPELQCLITEKASPQRARDEERHRSGDIETALISWCVAFGRGDAIKNDEAVRLYCDGLRKLKTWALDRNQTQIENEALRLLREAIELAVFVR